MLGLVVGCDCCRCVYIDGQGGNIEGGRGNKDGEDVISLPVH